MTGDERMNEWFFQLRKRPPTIARVISELVRLGGPERELIRASPRLNPEAGLRRWLAERADDATFEKFDRVVRLECILFDVENVEPPVTVREIYAALGKPPELAVTPLTLTFWQHLRVWIHRDYDDGLAVLIHAVGSIRPRVNSPRF